MLKYDENVKHVASEDEIQSKLVDQVIMSILESFKLACDIASVVSLLFTRSSFVHEQPLSAI